jgi:hypothetical protein
MFAASCDIKVNAIGINRKMGGAFCSFDTGEV